MSLGDHRLLLLRHAGTQWSITGQHTGRTELELTDGGRQQAATAAAVLNSLHLNSPLVFSSPRHRALATAQLAGLTVDQVSDDLAEWDYGRYEGLTTAQIRESDSDWLVWTHGCPDGESTGQVGDRADRAISLAQRYLPTRDVIFVGHGHFSRALITRWLDLPVREGIRFGMAPASVAVCGFEHGVRQLVALGLAGYQP